MALKAIIKKQPPGYRFETTNYDYCQVIYVCSGRLYFSHLNKTYSIKAGGIVFLKEGSEFSLFCKNDSGYDGIALIDIEPDKMKYVNSEKSCSFVAPPEARLVADLMHKEMHSPKKYSKDTIDGLARCFAAYCLRDSSLNEFGDPVEANEVFWADMVKQTIERSVYSVCAVESLFVNFDLSYRQLCRHFKKVYNVSPKEYQIMCKIEESKRLLVNTYFSITTISLELGFSSSQHFAQQFKKSLGISPKEYRNKKISD